MKINVSDRQTNLCLTGLVMSGHYALPWDKRQPYETDIRVPLFVRGPEIVPKSLVDTTVVNIDIAPTIADIAGLPVTRHMDGGSFLPYAKHTTSLPHHEFFFVEYVGEGDSNTVSSTCNLNNDNTLAVSKSQSS